MAGAPMKGFSASLLSDLIDALRSGDETSEPFPLPTFKPGPGESPRGASPELTQLQRIAGLRRGTATRQAAFRAARRRDRSRRSKVAASTVPLLLLGSVCVPAIAFATTGSSPSKPTRGSVARSTGEVLAFDIRTHLPADPSVQRPAAWVAPPTTTAPPAPPTTAAAPPTTVSVAVVSAQGRYLGTFVVTCYDLGGHTATGATPSTSTVAVDPRVIPLGTRINIAGVGERIAQDTGGAIRGNRLDIWEPTYSQCAAWGVQSRQVWIG